MGIDKDLIHSGIAVRKLKNLISKSYALKFRSNFM